MLKAQDPETGAKMSEEEVISENVIFLVAGHETTAHCKRVQYWAVVLSTHLTNPQPWRGSCTTRRCILSGRRKFKMKLTSYVSLLSCMNSTKCRHRCWKTKSSLTTMTCRSWPCSTWWSKRAWEWRLSRPVDRVSRCVWPVLRVSNRFC